MSARSDPAQPASPAGRSREQPDFAAARRLFEQVAAAEPAARAELLAEARREHPALCDEVEGMLRHHQRTDGLLDRSPVELAGLGSSEAASTAPAGGNADAALASERVAGTLPAGTRVGRYTIARVIGVGGMGVVYEAEQDSPRRAVALKLVRSELITASMARRFEHEAAALAMLHHPGIAQIFETGAAELGGCQRPFIAMELVRGPSLAEFARQIPLSTRQKLLLAAEICDAVQHAHQRGVIHRDLKPGNVLVDLDEPANKGEPGRSTVRSLPGRAPVPPIKILDFGVARLTDRDAGVGIGAGATLATRVGQIVGTLAYMSPEQAAGDPSKIDARTDIYAIGVILYELLAGRRPVAADSSTVAQALRAVEEGGAAPPSRFDRTFRGDIDTIVMRALAREPARRYQSASELAADIRRYLADEPISARPYSTLETLARAWRHRRPWFIGGLAVLATLAGGFASTLWQSQRAMQQSERAQRQAAIADEANRLLTGMLEAATPAAARGREITVREMVDTAARDVGDGSRLHPEVAASVLTALGETYTSLGLPDRAEPCLRRAVELSALSAGPRATATLVARGALSMVLTDLGLEEEADSLSKGALDDARATLPGDHPVVIELLSRRNYTLKRRPGDPEREALMSECVERCTRLYGPAHVRTLRTRGDRAVVRLEMGHADEALGEIVEVSRLASETLGEDHPSTIAYAETHAAALLRLGRAAEAEKIVRRVLELSQRVGGPQHPSTMLALRNLAVIVMSQGRFAEAEPISRRLLEAKVEQLGELHPEAIDARALYATALIMQRKVDAARPVVDDVHRLSSQAYGETHEKTIQAITLRYDLAEAADDRAEMARWAEKLKGTPFDPAKAKQTEIPR